MIIFIQSFTYTAITKINFMCMQKTPHEVISAQFHHYCFESKKYLPLYVVHENKAQISITIQLQRMVTQQMEKVRSPPFMANYSTIKKSKYSNQSEQRLGDFLVKACLLSSQERNWQSSLFFYKIFLLNLLQFDLLSYQP